MVNMSGFKDIQAPAPTGTLADVLAKVTQNENASGLDKVRGVLSLKLHQYADIAFTEQECADLAKQFQYIEIGSSLGLIMICKKSKCLYKNRCALYMNNHCPEGKECIYENIVLKEAMNNYVASFEVELDNYAEMVMINQLVEYEIIEHRCNAILSLDHTGLQMTSIIGIDESGQIITKEEISHALLVKDSVFKKKMEILREFTATRTQKWKKQSALKQAVQGPASMISSLKRKVLEAKNQSIIPAEVEAKLNVLSDDSY